VSKYFLNNKFVDLMEAKVEICDLGFLRGYGIFDLSLVIDNKVFEERLHLERLQNSAKILNIKLPYSQKKISNITKKLIEENNISNSRIRWILTGGVENKKSSTFIII